MLNMARSHILEAPHLTLFPAVIDELKRRGGDDITIFGGGIVPEEDQPTLAGAGVAKVFTPGATIQDVVEWVRGNVRPRA